MALPEAISLGTFRARSQLSPVLSLHLDQRLNFQWRVFMALKASDLGVCISEKTK